MNRDTSYLCAGTSALGWGPQGLGLGHPVGAAILSSLLIVVFVVWRACGLTFTLTRINTFRGEALFWTAILTSNTLGTSVGDFLSDSTGLGHVGGALLVAGVLLLLVIGRRVPQIPNVALFWIAFVLTRPLGATVGDFRAKPVAKGGLALGTTGSSAVLFVALAGLIVWSSVRERRSRSLAGALPEAA